MLESINTDERFIVDASTLRFMHLLEEHYGDNGEVVIADDCLERNPQLSGPRLAGFLFLVQEGDNTLVFRFQCYYTANGATGLGCQFRAVFPTARFSELLHNHNVAFEQEPDPEQVRRLSDHFNTLLDQVLAERGVDQIVMGQG